ncbi:hypothetical protein [Priestia megaterium]|uniref:hypothetical protein n=1 Tax=Priestia megaterium TaxID=1404 RepID=UPI002FFFB538
MFLMAVAKNLTNDEMVKKMQEQVISMQDKQMSFLNDTIGNTNDSITVFLTALGVISAVVIGVITYVHGQAKKRMDEAENKMNEATQKIDHAESMVKKVDETMSQLQDYQNELSAYRLDTEQKVLEISRMIDEKMQSLKEVENNTDFLVTSHKTRVLLGRIEGILEDTKLRIGRLSNFVGFEFKKDSPEYEEINSMHQDLSMTCGMYKSELEVVGKGTINNLSQKCTDLRFDCNILHQKIEDFIGSLPKIEQEYQTIEAYDESEKNRRSS